MEIRMKTRELLVSPNPRAKIQQSNLPPAPAESNRSVAFVPKDFRLFLILCCLWSSGCATFSPKPSWVIEANEKTVKGCRFLGTVEGNSSWGWLVEEGSLERAETEALHKAASLGATHLVWTKRESARWSHHVEGRAFDCR